MTEIKTNAIPHRLKNVNKEHPYVSGARDIYDDAKGKSQAEVNKDVDDAFALHQSEINALNSQNYVTVATYSALPATGSADTIYRVSSYDGTQVDDTVYSEYAWNGSTYVHLSTKTQIGEVFDISAFHATGGTLAKYANLTAALGVSGANVPESIRRGGMSVKYVQTSDNLYVQFRCIADEFTTDVTKWQGTTSEIKAGSNDLVESGGVYKNTALSNDILDGISLSSINLFNRFDADIYNIGILTSTGKFANDSYSRCICAYKNAVNGEKIYFKIITDKTYSQLGISSLYIVSSNVAAANGEDSAEISGNGTVYLRQEVRCNEDRNYIYIIIKFTTNTGLETVMDEILSGLVVGKTTGSVVYPTKYYPYERVDLATFNVNVANDVDNYNTKYDARIAVPAKFRKQGLLLTSKIGGVWLLEQFTGTVINDSTWGDANNERWITILRSSDIEDLQEAIRILSFDNNTLYEDAYKIYSVSGQNDFNYRNSKRFYGIGYYNTLQKFVSNALSICVELFDDILEDEKIAFRFINTKNYSEMGIVDVGLINSTNPISIDVTGVNNTVGNATLKRGYTTASVNGYLYLWIKLDSGIVTENRVQSFYEALKCLIVRRGTDTIDDTTYHDYYNFLIGEDKLVQLLRDKIDGSVSRYQGASNYNKILVVDSDGFLQLSDGQSESGPYDNVKQQQEKRLYLGANILSSASSIGTGWTYSSGKYIHTQGNTSPIVFNVSVEEGHKYVVTFEFNSIKESSVLCNLGETYDVDVYNGELISYVGFISNGNNKLTVTPASSWSGTIESIKLQEVVDSDVSVDSITINLLEVSVGNLINNVTGFWNTAIGSPSTLQQLINASRNIGIGKESLAYLKYGTRNIGVGTYSLRSLISGERNIGIGADAMYRALSGKDNIAIGKASLTFDSSSATGSPERNIAIGTASMARNGNIYDNIAIGQDAMSYGTGTNIKNNICIGTMAGAYANDRNICIGYQAGYHTSKGNENVCIGDMAQQLHVSGDYNVHIGARARACPVDTPTSSAPAIINNSIAIGYNATATKSNQVVIGNANHTEFVLGTKKIVFNNDNTVTWETIS